MARRRAWRAHSPGLDGAPGCSDDTCGEREDALHGGLLVGVSVPRTCTTISWYLSGYPARFPGQVERVSRRKVRPGSSRARRSGGHGFSGWKAGFSARAHALGGVGARREKQRRPPGGGLRSIVPRLGRAYGSRRQSAGCSSTRSGSTNGKSPSVPSMSGSPSPSTVICAATSASRRSWKSALPSPGEICSWR